MRAGSAARTLLTCRLSCIMQSGGQRLKATIKLCSDIVFVQGSEHPTAGGCYTTLNYQGLEYSHKLVQDTVPGEANSQCPPGK